MLPKQGPKKVVVIGGGTGSFTLLSALKGQGFDISALVSMADDGGSTGVLRDELGVLPPGDVRQCLVALSSAPEELRELFNFRFTTGSLTGHSFGNLFLSAVQKMTDNFGEAVRIAADVLRIEGRVLPVTLDDIRLVISWRDGTIVKGEGRIDIMHFVKEKGLPEISLEPEARLNPVAKQAISAADAIIVAPGDLYTSLAPLLVVKGVSEALATSSAKKIYVCNLVEKPGQTGGLSVAGHAAEIERFAGGPVLDYVIYNTARPSPTVFAKYKRKKELLVTADKAELQAAHYRCIGRPLVGSEPPFIDDGDQLAAHRSFIRHDAKAVTDIITKLLDS